MTVVTSNKKPVVLMEFQRKNVGVTSIGAPSVARTKIKTDEKTDATVKLENVDYFNKIDKTIVLNAKQALDTIVEKMPIIQNSPRISEKSLQIIPKTDEKIEDKTPQILEKKVEKIVNENINSEEFIARLVAPRTENNTFNIRLLESSDKSILIEEHENSVNIRSPKNALVKLADVEVVEAKSGDTLVYDESKNSWVNHPLTRLEVLKSKIENLVKEKEYALEDAVDVDIAGFVTKGQVLGFNDEKGVWENTDIKQIDEVKLNEGFLEIVNTDDSIHRVDLKRHLGLGDVKDAIIENPRRGQKLTFDGHVWRNIFDEKGIQQDQLMSFITFPEAGVGEDILEIGQNQKTGKNLAKVGVTSGLSVGKKFAKKSVNENHLVVSEAVGIGVENPDQALVINSGINGESGLKFTKLKSKKLEGETIGVNTKGEVVLIKNVSKFSIQIKPKNGEIIVNHNLNLTDAMAVNICCMNEFGEVLKTQILEATSNLLKLKTDNENIVRVTVIG